MNLTDVVPNPVAEALSTVDTQQTAMLAQIDAGSQQLATFTGDQCDLLGSLGGVLDDVAKEAAGAAQALTAGTMAALSDVGEAGSSMFDSIGETLGPLADGAEAIYNTTIAGFQAAYDAAVELGDEILQAQIIADVTAAIDDAMGAVGEYANAAADAALELVSDITSAVGNAVALIGESIDAVAGAMGEMIAAVSVASCAAATDVIAGLGDAATGSLQTIGNQATAGLGDLPAAGGGTLADKGANLIAGATSNATNALDGITNTTPPLLPTASLSFPV